VKMRFVLFLTLLCSPVFSFAAVSQCDLFKNAMRTSIGTDLPSTLEAGKNCTFTATLLPPLFVSTKLLSTVVKPGGTFIVETKVTDENPICGLAESLTNICSGVWHVALASEEGNEISSFEPNSLLANGLVVTLVKVPKDTKPGRYPLVTHDISDIFGNLFVDIPLDHAPVIEVASPAL
jgi:hypothetical protein